MNYKIIPSSYFNRQLKRLLKKYPTLSDDLKTFQGSLKDNPKQGKSLGKDCYKVRLAIRNKNKGKSAGARVITCVKIIDEKVYLLSIYN